MATIHEALPNEFNIIRHIAFETWPVCYGKILSKPQLDYMLARFYSFEALTQNSEQGHRFLLIAESGQPLGFAAYEHGYQNRNVTRIHKIYILPDTQGKGLGKKLLDEIQEIAKRHGSAALSLNVNRFNVARSFYEKFGFSVMGQEDIAIGEGWLMEDYIMEKPL